MFSYQLFSHKLLRWLVPFFMIGAFGANMALLDSNTLTYLFLFAAQFLFYGLGILGIVKPKVQKLILVKIPVYFIAVNASIFVAWGRYLSGQRIVTWTPTRR